MRQARAGSMTRRAVRMAKFTIIRWVRTWRDGKRTNRRMTVAMTDSNGLAGMRRLRFKRTLKADRTDPTGWMGWSERLPSRLDR